MVKEILEEKHVVKKGRARHALQEIFRNKGDHKHNMRVLEEKRGELIVSQRPTRDFRSMNYGPCAKCRLWVFKLNLLKHHEKCVCVDTSKKEKNFTRTTGNLAMDSDILADRIPVKMSDEMKDQVLGKLNIDEIGQTAKRDALILMLGKHWWRRAKKKLNRRRTVAEKIRRCAKLLLTARDILKHTEHGTSSPEEHGTLSMWGMLRPKYFDVLVDAAIKTTAPHGEGSEDFMKHPTPAIKVKYDLSRMTEDKIHYCSQKQDSTDAEILKKKYSDTRQQAQSFLHSLTKEWHNKVVVVAERFLRERQLDKIERLPLPDDVKLLNTYLRQECSSLDVDTSEVDMKHFLKNCKVIAARLQIFNRRRPIEVSGIQLKFYKNRSSEANIDKALTTPIDSKELAIFNSLDLIWTEGKGNQFVPVLVPEECHRALEWIASDVVRKQVGVHDSEYLFPTLSTSFPVVSASEALKDAAYAAGLKYPERIGAHQMRHYMATLAQVMSLTDFQFQHVLKHLGHTWKVHLDNYRLAAPSVERMELGKILLMQARNVQNLFQSRSLADVTFEEILKAEEDEQNCEDTVEGTDKTTASSSSSHVGKPIVVQRKRTVGETKCTSVNSSSCGETSPVVKRKGCTVESTNEGAAASFTIQYNTSLNIKNIPTYNMIIFWIYV